MSNQGGAVTQEFIPFGASMLELADIEYEDVQLRFDIEDLMVLDEIEEEEV
jgi:hypothetical protein